MGGGSLKYPQLPLNFMADLSDREARHNSSLKWHQSRGGFSLKIDEPIPVVSDKNISYEQTMKKHQSRSVSLPNYLIR